MIRRVELFLDSSGEAVPVGTLSVNGQGDLARSDFSYDPEFMYGGRGFDLSPRVRLHDGVHATRGLPLFVEDAGPDRWGVHLLRRQATQADPLRYLDAFDCIVGASDFTRQGALRFGTPDGEWLAGGGVPARLELDALLDAADQVVDDSDSFAAYAALLDTGTSALGGARPKAAVTDDDGTLWMAKFPQRGDRQDVPLWEEATLRVARTLGIDVPDSKLVDVCGRNVLLVCRFDRVGQRRIPYQSFRTLLNSPDDGTRPPDYLHIAPQLRAATGDDPTQFLRRVVFSIFVNNTDDHLRNMGLLRVDGGWHLAPAFDINPEPDAGKNRHTAVAGGDRVSTAAAGLPRLATAMGASGQLADEVEHISVAPLKLLEEAGALGARSTELGRFERALGAVRDAALTAISRA